MVNPIELVHERAALRSAVFIEENCTHASLFARKVKLHDYVASQIPPSGLMMECGVFKGASINRMAKLHPKRTIYGFDSFEGLSENWPGNHHQKGHFDLGGVFPIVEDNVVLKKGWVDDTLPSFLKKHKQSIAYLHIDTDTYSPAKTILELTKDGFVSGSIVMFDELYGHPNWENNEYKALTEALPRKKYEYIGFSAMSAAIRIL